MLYGYEGDSGLWLAGGKQKQWGVYQTGTYSTVVKITLPISMKNANYAVSATVLNGGSHYNDIVSVGSRTTTGFRLIGGFNGDSQIVQTAGIIVAGTQ